MTDSPSCPRRAFLADQDSWLAAYAVRDAAAGPRAHDVPPHPYRTELQRDRERILHCSAFRRLDFKTQVFVPHERDHCRTRLTHTLEVAQVARTLCRALRINEDLAEAAALAHDLGHPPFGHAGEEALDALMADHGHFEHNRQSLRVVDYLEHPYPPFRGLNLTRAVRECLARHETRYDAPVCPEFPPGRRGPAEGQVVDLADEIAYTAADLEDALSAGWIRSEDLADLSLWRRAKRIVETTYPDARPIPTQIRAGKTVLSLLADDAIAETACRADAMGLDRPDAARDAPQRTAALSDSVRAELDALQGFLLQRVYRHPLCLKHDRHAETIIADLFAAYAADPVLLPRRYRRRTGHDGLHRVACDYIAGMTDRFCRAEHARVCR